MPKKEELSVGQTVVVELESFLRNKVPKIERAKIIKIGRKLVELESPYMRDYKFEIATGVQKTEYSPAKFYTEAEYADLLKRREYEQLLNACGLSRWSNQAQVSFTLEELQSIANICKQALARKEQPSA